MKKIRILAVVLAMAFLCAGVASAEMYLEGYIGGAFSSNLNVEVNAIGSHSKSLTTTPSVIGGMKLGTWFVKEGTLGYNYPDWMRYFGFYTDFSYQRLDIRGQTVATFGPPVGAIQIRSEGMVATLAFMFAGRYGFLQDSEVPFGRLQPYIAVGPAIMFSSRDAKAGGLGFGSTGSTNIGLEAEGGIRYMALQNVSIDVSFKYRYANPSFDFNNVAGSPIDFKPTYNLFSGQLGVAYHF